VVWGSTYLAIKVGVGELPPFLFAGLRFLVAGLLVLGLALALGDRLPRRLSDWRTQGIVGLLLLAGGNAFVVWAEQYTPSGTASITRPRPARTSAPRCRCSRAAGRLRCSAARSASGAAGT